MLRVIHLIPRVAFIKGLIICSMHLIERMSDFYAFYKTARTPHDIHSPALFALINAVFDRSGDHPDFNKIEGLRKKLLKDQATIQVRTIGAPSAVQKSPHRTVAREAKGSLSPSFQGRWLHRLVRVLQPTRMLELGTSFGLSTLYQHLAAPTSPFVTIEGNQDIANRAALHWEEWQSAASIEPLVGLFDDALADLGGTYDYIFIDGDHRSESLLRYMDTLRKISQPGAVYVLHDIHWSQDMLDGWRRVIDLEFVTASIDLYHFGILLTDEAINTRQHLSVVPTWMKPWRLGIWGK